MGESDVSPHSEGDGEEDGDRVEELAAVGVEEDRWNRGKRFETSIFHNTGYNRYT